MQASDVLFTTTPSPPDAGSDADAGGELEPHAVSAVVSTTRVERPMASSASPSRRPASICSAAWMPMRIAASMKT